MRPAWVEVDLKAITENIRQIKNYVGEKTQVMGVVKANAYGHGAVEVAKADLRGGASFLGVAILEEAEQLRKAGIKEPILVLSPILPELAEEAIHTDADITISNLEVASALSEAGQKLGKAARVHVKVDSGMGRVGLFPQDVPDFIEKVLSMPAIQMVGLSSHYATADYDLEFAKEQLRRYLGVYEELKKRGISVPIRHTASSGGIAFLRDAHLDMVRPGLIQYGISPNTTPLKEFPLKPALSLKARLLQIRKIPADTSISYGRTYFTKKEQMIGIVPIGYGDGYSRSLTNKGSVLVHGKKVPICGRVCMDQFMVDLTSVPEAKLGDEAVVIGNQGDQSISAWDVASLIDTIPYEVTTNLSLRLPRVFSGEVSE